MLFVSGPMATHWHSVLLCIQIHILVHLPIQTCRDVVALQGPRNTVGSFGSPKLKSSSLREDLVSLPGYNCTCDLVGVGCEVV